MERFHYVYLGGEEAIARFGLTSHVQFLHADATVSTTYQSIAPADVLIVCGVFGNVRQTETDRLIESLRCLCRSQGAVLWTRSVVQAGGQQAAEFVRHQFSAAGFNEIALEDTTPLGFVVATHRFSGQPCPLIPGIKLFEFTSYEEIVSS